MRKVTATLTIDKLVDGRTNISQLLSQVREDQKIPTALGLGDVVLRSYTAGGHVHQLVPAVGAVDLYGAHDVHDPELWINVDLSFGDLTTSIENLESVWIDLLYKPDAELVPRSVGEMSALKGVNYPDANTSHEASCALYKAFYKGTQDGTFSPIAKSMIGYGVILIQSFDDTVGILVYTTTPSAIIVVAVHIPDEDPNCTKEQVFAFGVDMIHKVRDAIRQGMTTLPHSIPVYWYFGPYPGEYIDWVGKYDGASLVSQTYSRVIYT